MIKPTEHRLRTAVVGLGRIAWDYHLPRLCGHPGFELTVVVDAQESRIAEARDRFEVTAGYCSYEKMLAVEKPDLVVIASPTCFHAGQTLEAFRHGADVFCEKPLAGSCLEAEQLAEAMRHYGRRLMVYQPHRLTPEAIALKQILADGLLGDIFMVRRVCADFRRRNDWQARSELGGGMLNNYGSHFIDQFLHLFPGRAEVNAEMRRVVSAGDADDVVKALIVNEHKVIFDLEINMASAFFANDWQVCGSLGTARLDHRQGCWQVRFLDPAEVVPLEMQSGMAAVDRQYPGDEALPWREREYRLDEVDPYLFYHHCHSYFALGKPPFVQITETLAVMRLIQAARTAPVMARQAV